MGFIFSKSNLPKQVRVEKYRLEKKLLKRAEVAKNSVSKYFFVKEIIFGSLTIFAPVNKLATLLLWGIAFF